MGKASHRGHGGHKGVGVGGERALVDTVGFSAGRGEWGKHRTEVTEVTEGLGLVARELWWTPLASVREEANGESIAQRSRRSQNLLFDFEPIGVRMLLCEDQFYFGHFGPQIGSVQIFLDLGGRSPALKLSSNLTENCASIKLGSSRGGKYWDRFVKEQL
jgi:hypothetical protein